MEGLGGPRGRRKGRIGWARVILNPQSLIQLINYRLVSSTGAIFRVVVMSAWKTFSAMMKREVSQVGIKI